MSYNMFEGFLDKEGKYYDYGTSSIDGDNIVDTKKTGVPFYDDFLNPVDARYMREKKNLVAKIVMMTPEEYYKECSEKTFSGRVTVDNLKMQRAADRSIIEKLKNVLTVYKRKLCLPMINYAEQSQEGLHRMMAIGEIYGWDFKVPVLIVDWFDKQRAYDNKKQERIRYIEQRIRRAVIDTLYYRFNDLEELKSQLQWELDKQFENSDEVETPVVFEFKQDGNEFVVSIASASYSFDYDDIDFTTTQVDDDLDDVEFDVDDDFLVKYFGADWRETFPHLKDKFNIKENLSEDLNSIVKAISSHVDKHDSNGSNQNCLFSTWAVELQLRGEDFLPRPVYSPRDPIFDIKGENIVINPTRIKIKSKEDVRTKVLDAGEGARFYCHVNWAGSNGGHEFLIINDNNKVLIVDGQSGYINEIDNDKGYFEDINFKNSYIVRLDNKEINQDVLKYNDEDNIVEWDDDLDIPLLEEDFSNNNEFLHNLLDELSEFDYSFIDADGKELDDEDAMKSVVQRPEQLVELGKGVCTDFVEYTRAKLNDRKIPYKIYYIACTDKDGDRPSHVFVVVENGGKFLWVEASWHSEAGIHEYDSLEELFENIARKHCVHDGENYLDSCEIREIKKSLVGMSQEDIYDYVDTLPITWKAVEEGITEDLEVTQVANIEAMDKAIQEYFGQTDPGEGCIFIHPDGKFINIYPKLDDHEDLCYWLEEGGFGDNPEDPAWFVDEFNYIRCRNSLHLCFVELPKTITSSQIYALEEWFETKVTTNYIDIEAPNGEWNKYNLDEYFPEDIIKIIKRYYASGKLYEKLK